MKKSILIFVIAILACAGMRAQDIDTLPCGQRVKNYYYPHWIDTSDIYLHPDRYHINEHTNKLRARGQGKLRKTQVFQHYTETPLRM